MIYIDKYIEKCKESFDILAYCILPNHFHFVFHNKSSGYKISYFIGNICAAYTRYYQSKYGIDRGKIYFESRFKCKIIDDSEYLQKCIYYVENNPIRHGMVDDREYWKFRSASYIGNYHPGDKKQLAKIEAELE